MLVVSAIALSGLWHAGSSDARAAAAPALSASMPDPIVEDESADAPANNVATPPPLTRAAEPATPVRLPHPAIPAGPRRVGIQVGHWRTAEAPPELGRILQQTGATWDGIQEWEINLDVAERVAAILRQRGIVADVLWTAIPPGYLADAFVALHADSDGVGELSGFKMAHSTRRTPFEEDLQRSITQSYGAATQLEYDAEHVSRNMTQYYGFSWSRVRYSTSPFTPSVILEMGFLSNDDDRDLMMNEPAVVARAIADGILRFLDAHPREELFGRDLVVPPLPTPRPRPT